MLNESPYLHHKGNVLLIYRLLNVMTCSKPKEIKITSRAFDGLCQRNQYYIVQEMINYFNTHINFRYTSGTHCGKIMRECLQNFLELSVT